MQQNRAGIGDGFVEDDVLVVQHLAELGHEVMRIDRAWRSLVGGKLGGLRLAIFADLRQPAKAFGDRALKTRRRLRLQFGQQLIEDAAR